MRTWLYILLPLLSLSTFGVTPLGSGLTFALFVIILLATIYEAHRTLERTVNVVNEAIKKGKIEYSPSLQKAVNRMGKLILFLVVFSILVGLSIWSGYFATAGDWIFIAMWPPVVLVEVILLKITLKL